MNQVLAGNELKYLLSTSASKGTLPFLKENFQFKLPIFALKVKSRQIGLVQRTLGSILLNIPKLKTIVPFEADSPDYRLVLLDHKLNDEDISETKKEFASFLKEIHACIIPYDLYIPYEYWSTDDIIDHILPENLERIKSFETVGHIAHLNLWPEHEPYAETIGQIIIDKNKNIKTVVTKLGEIDSQFRVFPMKVIAGKIDFIAQASQNTCQFKFDYSKVYWNSRLEQEHTRMIASCLPSESVCDIFAGVGPFAIPLVKKGCLVFANDLNPDSFFWLNENKKLNKLSACQTFKTFNIDGKLFIQKAHEHLAQYFKLNEGEIRFFDHYVMNLPASAITFLEAFYGLARDKILNSPQTHSPIIHCYLFAKLDEDPLDILRNSLQGYPLTFDEESSNTSDVLLIHNVRRVAPNKDMFCISFKIPWDYLSGEWAPHSKKARFEDLTKDSLDK